MKNIFLLGSALSFALVICGCCKGPSEAELFGYKGEDLNDDEQHYFLTGSGETNYVPARVLNVYESYELTSNELAVIAAAGVIVPSKLLQEIPAGYKVEEKGPWFTIWTKEAENLGFKGVNGFISHFNDDKKVWETSETYFSSYWDSKEAAEKALATVKETLKGYGVKKFHNFSDSWIAEYVRLRVMGVVGQKPDGKWSCMLDIQDKCAIGCGQWEGEKEQQDRLNHYVYAKEMKSWKVTVDKMIAGNHSKIAAKRAEKGLGELKGYSDWVLGDDNRYITFKSGEFATTNDVRAVALWEELGKDIAAATGIELGAKPEMQKVNDVYSVISLVKMNELYTVRADVAIPEVVTNAEMPPEQIEAMKNMPGQWRIIIIENMLDGMKLPKKPELKKAVD